MTTMTTMIKSNERGLADHGWLKSRHTFSFADYYDPKRMGFSVLRVINEDRIDGGTGFGKHPHKDMEIISYVIDGALEHKDSMGTETVIRPGDLQRMSAGTGVFHSEYNHLPNQKTHFLQIWIMPDQLGIRPGYDQKSFASDFSENRLVLVASKNGERGSITVNQDMKLYACKTEEGGESTLKTDSRRHLWIQMIRGKVQANDLVLEAGDGVGLEKVSEIALKWSKGSEFLVFDLP